MEHTLLLNATYEPLKVIHWKRAITLLFQGKVEVLAFHDREIRGVSVSVRLPSVLRLLQFVRVRTRRKVRFSRANLFLRDGYRCQYCGKRFPVRDLTFDHVIPASRGGRKTWENIVTACWWCNNKKSGRTPEEAGMRLIRKPQEPRWLPALTLTLGIKDTPESWRDYLYWHVALDQDVVPS